MSLLGRIHLSAFTAALLCAVSDVRAGVSYDESAAFAFDTRDYLAGLAAESAAFAFDTRAVDGLSGSAVSGLFAFNTSFASAPPLNIAGAVQNAAGFAVSGATVALKRYETVFWQGTTSAAGTFSAPNLSPWDYMAFVTKAGYVTHISSHSGSAGGNQSQSITMTALPTAPATETTTRTVSASAVGTCTPWDQNSLTASRLLVLNANGQWTISLSLLNPNLPTVVLTHGWQGNPTIAEDWTKTLAPIIQSQIGAGAANIVAWDWHTDAHTQGLRKLVPPTDKAACQGVTLGYALMQSLGSGYSQHVHFIGHSLGAIVNRFACDYLHHALTGSLASNNPPVGWSSSATRPHVTLLDEAEIASVAQTSVLLSAGTASTLAYVTSGGELISTATATAAAASNQAKKDWKYPIPANAHWVDNYISAVGFERDEAVNVCLPGGAYSSINPGDAHGYAHVWYEWSTYPGALGLPPPVGFRLSAEYAGIFPPSGSGLTKGSVWNENLATADLLDLTLVTNPQGASSTRAVLSNYVAGVAQHAIVDPLDSVGQSVLNGYVTSVEFVSVPIGTAIYKTGQVVTSTSQKIGLFFDALLDSATDLSNTVDPKSQLAISSGSMSVQFSSASSPPQMQGATSSLQATAAASATPGAWMIINVPANAGMLAFDFTATGDPVEDMVVCVVNDLNLFTLPAKFVTDGSPVSTDMMDISAYAGQSVELFFGLVGGTSTNCTLAVDGIRFITIPEPKIGIADAGANFAIKWPAAATGWLLESSDTLAPGSWQTVSMAGGVAVASGVATLEVAKTGDRRFYRLRRAQ